MNCELQWRRAWALKLQNGTSVALVPSWAIASLKSENVSRSVSNPLQPMDCSPPGSSVHENSPSKNTGMGCHALLQRIFPTQGLNPGLPCCRRILYQPSYQGLKITNSHPFLIVSAWEQPTRDGSLKDCVDIKMML